MRRTKIIATLGPASSSEETVDELIGAGVDVFRLNFSHGTRETHEEVCERVRRLAARRGRVIAVMQDLAGPKIRTGRLEGGRPLRLEVGDELEIAAGGFTGGASRVSMSSDELPRAVGPGDRLLLDDGRIELRAEDSDGTTIRTTVVSGGELGENKGINAPGVPLALDSFTSKDEADLRFGVGLGVDFIALSFVRNAGDVDQARARLRAAGGAGIPLVAKIERPEALDHMDGILGSCDAVMVARGDLGLELPLERVPRVQKEITRAARRRALPVIVATQVLESMRTEPRPTRAEVSDAAHAVDEGVDAIMLAGETAIGKFPARTVRTLDAIVREAEVSPLEVIVPIEYEVANATHSRALCEAAVTLASSGQAEAIVAVTYGGKTARMLSALRPPVPIFAATQFDTVARRLALLSGVTSLLTEPEADLTAARTAAEHRLLDSGQLTAGARVVFVSVNPDLTREDMNFLDLRRLGS